MKAKQTLQLKHVVSANVISPLLSFATTCSSGLCFKPWKMTLDGSKIKTNKFVSTIANDQCKMYLGWMHQCYRNYFNKVRNRHNSFYLNVFLEKVPKVAQYLGYFSRQLPFKKA